MRNTSAVVLVAASAIASTQRAHAQRPVDGFASERLFLSAPGAGFIVLDDLRWEDGLGGALSLSLGYAHRAVVIRSSDGATTLPVVEHQTLADLGVAVSYDRFRLYTHLSSPLYVAGRSGTVDGLAFSAPAANLDQNPDTIADVQLGFETRLLGRAADPLKIGVSGVLIFPSGTRADYLSDGTYRGATAAMIAGDAAGLSYAARVGAHIRPLDESPARGAPRGSELLFGGAIGRTLPIATAHIVLGPELYGATAFGSLFGSDTTALEALLTGRIEASRGSAARFAIKFGIGAGIQPRFGAPQWRAILGFDLAGTASSAPDLAPERSGSPGL